MHATSNLLRLTLLLAALSVVAGPLSAWDLFADCITDCCCGSPIGSVSDDCGCEVDAPAEPAPPSPWAPVALESLPGLDLDHVPARATVPSDAVSRPAPVARVVEHVPVPGPPVRLLHCSLTI